MKVTHVGNQWATKWLPPHDEALRRLHEAGASASQSAAKINQEFHTDYSRNAAIGRKSRLGLTDSTRRPRVPKRPKKPPAPKFFEPKPDAQVALRCVEVEPLNLTLAELDQAKQCHYIAGDDHLYCGRPSLPDLPYCRDHMLLCVRPR